MSRGILLIGLLIATASCVRESYVDEPADRMLQIDAIFYRGAPIPEIQVRHAFKVTGREPFRFNRNERWTLGATVLLRTWDTTQADPDTLEIPLREVQPGRFRPLQPSLRVLRGFAYAVDVRWDGLHASAEARIPEYDASGVQITNETPRFAGQSIFVNRIDPSQLTLPPYSDTMFVYASKVRIEYTASSAFMAVQYGTDHEFTALAKYVDFDHDVVDPSIYESLYLDERNPRFVLTRDVYGLYPYLSSGNDRQPANLRVVVVLPEDIYADYARTDGDFLLPATPTNVTNGVGLFIGAVRDTLYYEIPFFFDL